MPIKGDTISKQSVVNQYVTSIKNPAYNAVVYWNGSNPGSTRMNIAALGNRDFTDTLATDDITGNTFRASIIIDQVKAFARYTTTARRARSGLINDSGTTDDRTDVCRLSDSYLLNYTYGGELTGLATSNSLTLFMETIRTQAAVAQTGAPVVDLRVCHSSCHSACHGSRGRR